MHHRPSRRLAALLSFAWVALAAGCATIDDPVTLEERSSANAIPLQQVLIVLDYRLDARATGRGLHGEKHLDRLYNPLGEMMAQAVTAAGGQPTVVHVRTPAQAPTVSGQYSHVWMQRITSLTDVSSSGGNWAEQRQWLATVAHRPAPSASLVPAYRATYVSDGVLCFGAPLYGNKDDCKTKFRALVLRQLQHYQAGG